LDPPVINFGEYDAPKPFLFLIPKEGATDKEFLKLVSVPVIANVGTAVKFISIEGCHFFVLSCAVQLYVIIKKNRI
jgi:hypothetical protein